MRGAGFPGGRRLRARPARTAGGANAAGAGVALALILAPVLVLGAAAPAAALPVAGGEIVVDVTAADLLWDAGGAELHAGGTASLDEREQLVLPVTGGDVDPADFTGSLELAGAEIVLVGDAGRVVLRALSADLTLARVMGGLLWEPVSGPAVQLSGVPLFSARSCALSLASDPCFDRDGAVVDEGFGLDWAGAVVQVLADAFFEGVPVVRERDPFGVGFARLQQPVPEPAAAGLVAAGLLAAFWVRRARPR